jgi:hypothetical protein
MAKDIKRRQRPRRQGARDPVSLVSVGAELTGLTNAVNVDEQRAEYLLEVAVELGEANPETISRFICEHLLPRCMRASPDDAVGRARSSRLRKLLVNWLQSLPDATLWKVREPVLATVVEILRDDATFEGMYSLSAIGYRTDSTVAAFRTLGERDDRLGHEALRLLLSLAPAADIVEWVASRIRHTPFENRTDELLNAAAQLHDTRWLPFLANDARRRGPGLFTLPRLMWVGKQAPGDRRMQEEIWDALSGVAKQWPDGTRNLVLTGGLVRGCHTPKSLGAFLSMVPEFADRGGPLVQCLRQIVEPESLIQLGGWDGAPISAIVDGLRPLVEPDTGHTGVGHTSESLHKELAIQALMCSGSDAIRAILETALGKETNVFTCAEIMRSLALLPLLEIPGRVHNILSGEPELSGRGTDNQRIVMYLAAARAAASSRQFDSFKVLLYSNGLIDGHPLTVPVAEAVHQAVWLAERSRAEVVATLLAGLTTESSPFVQMTSVRALSVLLREESLDVARGALEGLIGDTRVMPYVRRAALALRARTPDGAERDELRSLLVRMSDQSDDSVRFTAISALVDVGALNDERDRIEQYAFEEPRRGDRQYQGLIVGRLAAADADRYAGRAAQLISGAGTDMLHAVVDGYLQSRDARATVPGAILGALVHRIRRDESEVKADPPLMEDLAALAPERFLTELWEEVWTRWMPQSRCTFADLVPRALASVPVLRERAENLLAGLMGDAAFAVRRCASRSLNRVNPSVHASWCRDRAQSGSIQLRCLAMEAASRVEIDSTETLDNGVVRSGRTDVERAVRDAADRSHAEMQKRTWAQALFREIKRVVHKDEEYRTVCYRLGTALARVGDDEDLAQLRAMSADITLPPNITYWCERTADELEKQWKRTTGEWPQPWPQWDGAIERVHATLSAKGIEHELDLHLWRRRAKGAEGFSGWGGAASVAVTTDLWQFAQLHEDVSINVTNRPSARALIVGVNNTGIVLTGTGPYPSERD